MPVVEFVAYEVKHRLLKNMEDELNLDLDKIEGETESKLKVKDRFAKLSEKVTVSAKEKADAEAKAKAEAERASALEKERDFFKGFSAHSTKYPNAPQYQDKIWEKVKLGYTQEDAIVAVLNAEGKLNVQGQVNQNNNQQNMQQNQQQSREVAGGSSVTNTSTGEKTIESMTLAEKLEELKAAEKRGDISLS